MELQVPVGPFIFASTSLAVAALLFVKGRLGPVKGLALIVPAVVVGIPATKAVLELWRR